MPSTPNSVLHGGPTYRIPEHARARYVPEHHDLVKLACGNSYEHFARTLDRERRDGMELQVFCWTHSTFVAE